MGRRDSNDLQWQEVKRQVRLLDKGQCLLCRALTVAEAKIFKENLDGFSTSIIDPAHYKAVSTDGSLCYDVNNVFSLCRQMHERIDYGKNPITGKPATKDEIEAFWQRIIAERNKTQAKVELPEFFLD